MQRYTVTLIQVKTKDDTGVIGIDISELIRVYDIKSDTHDTCIDVVKIEQHNTVIDADEFNTLKTRLAVLEAENHHLKDHVDSLKQAMLMLEHKEQKKEKSSSWLSRLFTK